MSHALRLACLNVLFSLSLFLTGCGSGHDAPRIAESPPAETASAGPYESRPVPVPSRPYSVPDLKEARYLGSKSCIACGHEKIYHDWSDSLHIMLRQVDPRTVSGNFDSQVLEHRGWYFRMYRKNADFLIQEVKPDGTQTVYRVDYTLGNKRIQHYLTLRPDGRIRVCFPTWDVLLGKWIHGSEVVRTAHNASGELVTLPVQVWNENCYNCHTSQEDQGFDIDTNTFKTTFTETGINCEVCHGPGSLHVERMQNDPEAQDLAIVSAGRLSPSERMTDCLQCHARRIMLKKGYQPGENYYDYYMPRVVDLRGKTVPASRVWTERHWRFANECLNIWESECFVKGGATCISCHDAHQVTMERDPRYRNTDVLCLQCHRKYNDKAVVAAHTHHSLEGKGSRCVECHMLLITSRNIKILQNAEIRDHNIGIPIPENTLKHNIPNACNNSCHLDRSTEWVVEWMDRWYPGRRKTDPGADAIAAARMGKAGAGALLMARLDDPGEKVVTRASAAAFLGEFPGEDVAAALIRALDDRSALVRAEAARSLSENPSPASAGPLKRLLRDPSRAVRLNAVFAFIKKGILSLEGGDADAFREAKAEYLDFLTSFPEIYGTRVDLGTYYALHQDYPQAYRVYQSATVIRPDLPLAYYYLGITAAQLGRFDEAVTFLNRTLRLSPDFRNTRQLILQIREMAASSGRN